MGVSLRKGGNVSLSKEAPGLSRITIGLGWDARATDGAEFDLDASVFMTGKDGKCAGDGRFVFYGAMTSGDGSVVHNGDNRTGDGEGDDETVDVNLGAVPADVEKLVVAVSIHDAEERSQNFGQVSNAFIRIVNAEGGAEIARFDLTEDMAMETAMLFGEVYRHGGEWKFRALGAGYEKGFRALVESHGISVS